MNTNERDPVTLITRSIIIIAAILIVGSLYFLLSSAPKNNLEIAKNSNVQIGGAFTLIDQDGKEFNSDSLNGKYSLLYFGFTFCPDICPDSLQKVARVLDNLKSYNVPLQPVFITLDPSRDTPELLKKYVAYFNPNFIALTGSEAQIKHVANLFKVYYAKVEGYNKDYMLDHSAFIYLIDKSGKYLAHFDTADKVDVITYTLTKILKADGSL
jgi:protein SCO1/2